MPAILYTGPTSPFARMMEAGLQRRMELIRPEGEKSPGAIAKLEARIDRALAYLERDVEVVGNAGVRMDTIAVAVALEYTDFRYQSRWRRTCPELAGWLEGFARRQHDADPPAGRQVKQQELEAMPQHEVLCPLPGTFYRKPAPDAEPFVKEGDVVKVGDTIGLVEVMKQFSEVQADQAGKVVRFLVDNEGTVEPGQPLVALETT